MIKIALPLIIAGSCLIACFGNRLYKTTEGREINLNASELASWTSINVPSEQWIWKGDTLISNSEGDGYLRSPKIMENFKISFEASCIGNGNTGLILSATALPKTGSPYPDGIPVALNGEKWTNYLIESSNGIIRFYSNNKLEFSISNAARNKGFLCFIKSDNVIKYRNIRLTILDSNTGQDISDPMPDTQFKPLYTGKNLDQWQMKTGHEGHWTAQNWFINYDGLSKEKDKCLWTKKSYKDFEMIADWRLTRVPTKEWSPVVLPNGENELNQDGTIKQVLELYAGDTGIYLRGHSKNQINIGYRYLGSGEIYGYRVDKSMPPAVRAAVTPKVKADKPPGEWNRFKIRMKGDRITVVLNGLTVIDNAELPGIASEGPIALQDDHASNNTFQFANLFIKEL